MLLAIPFSKFLHDNTELKFCKFAAAVQFYITANLLLRIIKIFPKFEDQKASCQDVLK
jgi:hypothetical protein